MTAGRARLVAAVAAAVVLTAAVAFAFARSGSGDEVAATTTTPTTAAPTTSTTEATTTTTAPTTTVPPPPECEPVPPGTGPPGPLTGRPVEAPGAEQRAALVVKIDNYDPSARPQAGLTRADIVVEEKVEGPVSRFAAVFHSTSSEVGPVRSARSTDVNIARTFGLPLFAYSGASGHYQALVDQADLVDVGAGRRSGAYWRAPDRPVPYNLWARTGSLWSGTPAVPPPPQWAFRPEGAPPPGGGRAVTEAAYHFGGHVTSVRWRWDGERGTFARWQNGTPHLDADWCQVEVENVIVQLVDYVDTGVRDVTGGISPEAELYGAGPAWVLTGGQAVPATWQRLWGTDPTAYLGPDGAPIAMAPGRTWVALVPAANGLALG